MRKNCKSDGILFVELRQLFIQTDEDLVKLIKHYLEYNVDPFITYNRLKSVFVPMYSSCDRLNYTLNSMVKYNILKKTVNNNIIIYELIKDD